MTKLLFEHFVVLMLENRSFDHLFGYLGVGEGLAGVSATNYRKPLDKKTTAFNAQRGANRDSLHSQSGSLSPPSRFRPIRNGAPSSPCLSD